MAEKELSKLSQDQIQKLAKTLSEAKDLTNQQAEIIEEVLSGEDAIGKRRIAHLKEYFDTYSKNLDLVAKKYANTTKEVKEFGSARADLVNEKRKEEALNKIKLELEEKRRKLEYEARSKHNGKLLKKDAIEIEKQLAEEYKKRSNNQKKLAREYKEAFEREFHEFELKELSSIDSRLAEAVKTYENRIEAHTKELESARNQDPKLQDYRQAEVRLKELDGTLSAELEAQNLLNKFNAETAFANTSEAAEFRARETNAKSETAARNELAKQKDAFRDQLNAEAMAKNNGILTPGAAAESARLTEEKFKNVEERLAAIRKRNAIAAADPKLTLAAEEQKAKRIAELEYEARRRNNGLLLKEDEKRIKEQAELEFEYTEANLKRIEAIQQKAEREKLKEKERADKREDQAKVQYGKITNLDAKSFENYSVAERMEDLRDKRDELKQEYMDKGADEDAAKMAANFKVLTDTLSSLAQDLEKTVDTIAGYKGFIDTRLQGSNNEKVLFSYWDQLTKDMIRVGAVTPYFKQEKFAENIKSLVDTGIAFDLKQRAFLMTIQEKIANTFEVADGTLLRLVRIQQEDSTAGRLGMESALNTFLNNMYENTEYLKTVASGVRSSLQEMEALMSGAEATEVEYQVQKWMGSLYSVGMSQEAVNNIAGALGQIAAGQVDALTSGSGAGNLLVMAANEAGIPISDVLAKGLDASETNKLLQATVNYLAELAEASKDNNVVQQQLASVFGVKASDLKAATNLSTGDTISSISNEQLTYDNMLRQLYKMAGTMGLRTSLGEMMTNVWDNGQYTLAGSMASSPVSYLLYKVAGLLESTTGGIDIGLPMVFGNGLPVQFKVSDLMRAGSMATGILGTFGSLINGLASSFSGHMMLASMGIDTGSGLAVTPRGTGGSGIEALAGGGAQTTSGSGYVGNASASDIKDSTIQQNEDDAKQQMIEAKEEAEANQIDFINTNVLKIYELLDEVANGKRSLNVKVSGYGLTNLGSNTSLSSAQGGVSGLLSNTPTNSTNNSLSSGGFTSGATSSSSSSSSGSTGSSDRFGSGSGIDLGGWTMM